MWIDLSYSYGHFEGLLLSTQKAWINTNLDTINSWCEYYGPTILFFQDHNDVQWSMDYGPTHGFQSNVQTLEENFFQWIVIWSSEFMRVIDIFVVPIIEFVEEKRKISNLTFIKTRLWNQLYEHMDLMVCRFAELFYTIDMTMNDDVITTFINWWENKKRFSKLM